MGQERALIGQPGSARCLGGHEHEISDYRIAWSEIGNYLCCPECNQRTENEHEYADGRVWDGASRRFDIASE